MFENSVVDLIYNLFHCKLLFFDQNLHLLFYFDPILVGPILLLSACFQPGKYCKLPMTPWPSLLFCTGVNVGETYQKILQPCFIVESEVQSGDPYFLNSQ